jgi:hypothetical protein
VWAGLTEASVAVGEQLEKAHSPAAGHS